MKAYNSFLIRCWRLEELWQDERCIFEIEHVQTGERLLVGGFGEVHQWLLEMCKTKTPKTNHSQE